MSKLLSFEFLDETFESIGEVLAGMKESRMGIVDIALGDIERATAHIPETIVEATPATTVSKAEVSTEVVDLEQYRINKLAETEQKLGSDVLQSLSQEERLAEARAMITDLVA